MWRKASFIRVGRLISHQEKRGFLFFFTDCSLNKVIWNDMGLKEEILTENPSQSRWIKNKVRWQKCGHEEPWLRDSYISFLSKLPQCVSVNRAWVKVQVRCLLTLGRFHAGSLPEPSQLALIHLWPAWGQGSCFSYFLYPQQCLLHDLHFLNIYWVSTNGTQTDTESAKSRWLVLVKDPRITG